MCVTVDFLMTHTPRPLADRPVYRMRPKKLYQSIARDVFYMNVNFFAGRHEWCMLLWVKK
jgi:hypothetical protein